MNPKARRSYITSERVGDELVVLDTRTSTAHHLHPVTALVWYNADGKRSVQDLLELVRAEEHENADEETVWLALDALAEAGLLEERLAPPSGTQRLSRRNLMRRAAAVGVGITTLPISPLLAQSAPGDQEQATKEQQAKTDQEQTGKSEQQAKQGQEQASKEQQQKQNAEQQQKQGAEENAKQAEQQAKQNQEQATKEQQGKQGQEQTAKEQQAKQSEQQQKQGSEQSSKEQQVKRAQEQQQKQSQEQIAKQG